VEGKRI
jgi:predicted aspartyl protease